METKQITASYTTLNKLTLSSYVEKDDGKNKYLGKLAFGFRNNFPRLILSVNLNRDLQPKMTVNATFDMLSYSKFLTNMDLITSGKITEFEMDCLNNPVVDGKRDRSTKIVQATIAVSVNDQGIVMLKVYNDDSTVSKDFEFIIGTNDYNKVRRISPIDEKLVNLGLAKKFFAAVENAMSTFIGDSAKVKEHVMKDKSVPTTDPISTDNIEDLFN